MAKLYSTVKEEDKSPSSSLQPIVKNTQDFDLPPMDVKHFPVPDDLLPSPTTSTPATMSLEVKHEPDVKPDVSDSSPSQSPHSSLGMSSSKFETSSTPTPPPSTVNGTGTHTPTPPPSVLLAAVESPLKRMPSGPQLIGHLPVAREGALSSFNELSDNNYQFKTLGRSREALESMTCDCTYEHGIDNVENACGPYSDCINRLTQVECLSDDCRCRTYCQNQRFQRKEYANIEIVLTEKKGYGLRAEEDLPSDTFIYEYLGDVVNPVSFKKRMRNYATEGIQHFYFMMLQKDEFIDATKSGGIGRFANHSCSPNCYVAKWTIGEHVRMGIFSKRSIKKHEELTFNYNVDRYGHQAQECYCGEPNCVGFIGGKTQTDIATMDDLYLDALGITDEDDLIALKGTKKRKGKKIDDPDFMPMMKPIVLKDVPKVVQAIRQTTSRKVLHKLLTRVRITDDQAALRQIMRLRGYSLMTNVLQDHASDMDLVALVLECMIAWPLLNRNKVEDSKVIVPVQACASLEHEGIVSKAQKLLDHWETLPLYTRIPKRVRTDDNEDHRDLPIPLFNDDEGHSTKKMMPYDQDVDLGIKPLGKTNNRNYEDRDVPKPDDSQKIQAWIQARMQSKQSIQAIIAAAAEEAAEKERATIASAAAAKQAEEEAEERVARKKLKLAKKTQTPEEKEANKEKRMLKLVGAVVVKCMSKHSKTMDHDLFKKHAKELTQLITDKEKKSSNYKEGKLDALSDEKVAKIKKFAKEYISKILRKMEKSGKRHKHHPPSSVTMLATPSTSIDTPTSGDGDIAMADVFVAAEDEMDMDFASDSDEEEDEEGNPVDSDRIGQESLVDRAVDVDMPPPEASDAANGGHDPMDSIDQTELSRYPSDPRRRPPAEGLVN